MKDSYNWRVAVNSDIQPLTEIFWKNLHDNPSYISHGEMQMGIADGLGNILPSGRQKWVKYISGQIDGTDKDLPSIVFILEDSNKGIAGFEVLSVMEDGDLPFGVICDMWVDPSIRGCGLGKKLVENAKDWFYKQDIKDIYLESGKNNHSAHGFFEKMGFGQVSFIFKLNR